MTLNKQGSKIDIWTFETFDISWYSIIVFQALLICSEFPLWSVWWLEVPDVDQLLHVEEVQLPPGRGLRLGLSDGLGAFLVPVL